MNATTVPVRGSYQGVAQIVQFNWRTYLAALICGCLAVAAWPFFPPAVHVVLLATSAPALFWLITSLLVSHYVYDRSSLYDLHWLARSLSHVPRRWINIHSGWDETSGLLAAIFLDAIGEAVDIFDPKVMTETSIREARLRNRRTFPSTPARFDALPFEAGTVDAAFVLFAAHELRRHDQRVRLFAEIARILTQSGECLLMEHARDGWNFFAFGPGFLHFFSQSTWRKAARQASLEIRTEFSMTRFVHVFVMRRTQ
jgi:SAM-dependent methyltransferase